MKIKLPLFILLFFQSYLSASATVDDLEEIKPFECPICCERSSELAPCLKAGKNETGLGYKHYIGCAACLKNFIDFRTVGHIICPTCKVSQDATSVVKATTDPVDKLARQIAIYQRLFPEEATSSPASSKPHNYKDRHLSPKKGKRHR